MGSFCSPGLIALPFTGCGATPLPAPPVVVLAPPVTPAAPRPIAGTPGGRAPAVVAPVSAPFVAGLVGEVLGGVGRPPGIAAGLVPLPAGAGTFFILEVDGRSGLACGASTMFVGGLGAAGFVVFGEV